MTAEPLPSYTFEEYLALERDGEARHEWVGGRIFAMSGASMRHDLVAMLVHRALAPGAEADGCLAFMHNRLVRFENAAYYPDVSVFCGHAANSHYEDDVRIAIEVVSPSTATQCQREKPLAYLRAASIEAYILLEPDQPQAEVARRVDGWPRWESHGPGSVITTSVGDLDLDAIHAEANRLERLRA